MENNKRNYVFMALAKGSESTEGVKVKRYVGIGSVKILAVNPTKEELEKLYNTSLDKNPEYVGVTTVGEDNHEVPNVRIDFIVKTDPEKNNNIELTTKATYFVSKAYRFNKDNTKVQVIDKYGRTAWVTKEQAKNHEIPVYSNGPANLDKDYRPAYVGEENLTNFLKAYLNIPNVMKYVNKTWVMVDNPEECEARLDNIESYFKGDFTELSDAISLQPNNKCKVLFGVKVNDGKEYQDFYKEMVLKNNVTDYTRLENEVASRKSSGAYPNTYFVLDGESHLKELCEYEVKPTEFTNNNTNDPFANNTDSALNTANEDDLPWSF